MAALSSDSYEHKQRRRLLRPLAYGQPCPFCGKVMTKDDDLDLDHSLPAVLGGTAGDRMAHSHCNRAAGAALGNRLRAGTHHSRDW